MPFCFLFMVENRKTQREKSVFFLKKIVIYLVYKQEAKTEFRKTK